MGNNSFWVHWAVGIVTGPRGLTARVLLRARKKGPKNGHGMALLQIECPPPVFSSQSFQQSLLLACFACQPEFIRSHRSRLPARVAGSSSLLFHTPNKTLTVTTTMPSKFTEILDPESHIASPRDDVRLEDIIGAADMSSRGRTSSGTSSRSASSSSGEQVMEEKTRKRLSRLLGGGKR